MTLASSHCSIGNDLRRAANFTSRIRQANFLSAGWRGTIDSFSKTDTRLSRSDALELVSRIAGKQENALVIAPLGDRSGGQLLGFVPASALRALNNIGDCSELPRVRALLGVPQSGEVVADEGTKYIRYCGNQGDLHLLEEVANRQAGGSRFGGWEAIKTIKLLYEMAGSTSLPAIRRIVSVGAPAIWKVEILTGIPDPKIESDLRRLLTDSSPSIQTRAARALAQRGKPEGVAAAAGIALDRGQDLSTRAMALDPLEWFSGPSLKDFSASRVQYLQARRHSVSSSSMQRSSLVYNK